MSVNLDRPATRSSPLSNVMGVVVVLAVIGVIYVLSGGPVVERKVVLGRSWPASDLLPIDEIDHRDWDRLLRRFVDDSGNVAYSDWNRSLADVEALDAYLASLSRANPVLDARRDSRLAFWINAYNALTIRGILREFQTIGVPSHVAPSARFDIWSDHLLRVGGHEYSLGQIEHQLLRPLREPRIHFAIVCGSRGCPRLLNRAYNKTDLERQLHDNSRHFFADPQKLEFDRFTGQLRLSPILKWYSNDFGDSEVELLKTIVPYLPDDVSRELLRKDGLRPDYLDYDGSLNDQSASNSTAPIPPDVPPAEGDGAGEEPM